MQYFCLFSDYCVETTILSGKSFGCINQKPYRGDFEFCLLIDTITYENENIGYNFTLGIK